MNTSEREYFVKTILPCHARMYGAALAITGSPEDAADAVQTAMMKVWEKIGNGSVIESPGAYCLATVRNVCLSTIGDRKHTLPIEKATGETVSDTDMETALELADVKEIIGKLTPQEQQALRMRAYAGCSAADIAAVLGTTSANARQILSRARKRLRCIFTDK